MKSVKRVIISQRNDGLDILKAICAFLIICIHCPYPGTIGACFMALTRIAVPIFFIISGFFYQSIVYKGGEFKQVKKILFLTISANIIFLVWKCICAELMGGYQLYLTETITLKALVKFLFLNESPFNGHLWYLGAILYTLVIMGIINNSSKYLNHLIKVLYIMTPFLLICDLALGKYSILLLGREFPYILVRNFLFVGISYFSIGMLLFQYKAKIKQFLYGDKKSLMLAVIKLIVLSVLFSITSLIERYVLVRQNMNAAREHYISTTFLAITVFLLFIEIYRYRKLNLIEKTVAKIGRVYSTWIYILHPILITVLGTIIQKLGVVKIYSYIEPIIVYAFTTVIVMIMQAVFKSVKGRVSFFEIEQMQKITKEKYVPHTSTRYKNKGSHTLLKEASTKKDYPELYEKRENCCGCSACYSICPMGAITMEFDEEGFLYPIVDAAKCICCKKCLTVCAFKADQKKKDFDIVVN